MISALTQAFTLLLSAAVLALRLEAGEPAVVDLRVGIAQHAFDHLGGIGDQTDAAAASGATIIYTSGVGAMGYQGLPPEEEFQSVKAAAAAYIYRAKAKGIKTVIGYVCATSIVGLQSFATNWPEKLRARFSTVPAKWQQYGADGNPLPSWYGGEYRPACMNNPDWRAYEKFIVGQQLAIGCDGIFFDNPTVHPSGCFCPYCMEKFGAFLVKEGLLAQNQLDTTTNRLELLRHFAAVRKDAFLRFRCGTAADFIRDMRNYARQLKPGAVITANNSLNSSDSLFSQCRAYAYNIYEMSKSEDLVVVEDMGGMPRSLGGGHFKEYSPTYHQLNAIGHGKPIVAVTLAEADYHTPPDLVRLAMAEAAANGASYLGWPTWPENQRQRMIQKIRPEADFLRAYADLLGGAVPRADVTVYLPFEKWITTNRCRVSEIAAALSQANIQYRVVCEDMLQTILAKKRMTRRRVQPAKVLLVDSTNDLLATNASVPVHAPPGWTVLSADHPNWIMDLKHAIKNPSLEISGPAGVRCLVSDQRKKTVVHLLNLNCRRVSSFEDNVTPLSDISLEVRVPLHKVHSVHFLSADAETPERALAFTHTGVVNIEVPRLQVSALLVIE